MQWAKNVLENSQYVFRMVWKDIWASRKTSYVYYLLALLVKGLLA